jgi:hypothetical protein
MREAHQVLNALPATAEQGTVHHLIDVHVRGLLTMFTGDERLCSRAATSSSMFRRTRCAATSGPSDRSDSSKIGQPSR